VMMEISETINKLRSEGRTISHDAGFSKNTDDDIDQEKLNQGISFLHRNFFSMFVSMLTGLLTLMYIETIAAVLYVTNKSNSSILSFSRYLSTLNHTISWYKDFPKLIQSTAKVRQLHRQASLMKSFTQYEMVVTQWAFVGPVLLWPDKLGISERESDQEGLVYVMYLVGRELGICEEFNMCRGDLARVKQYSQAILDQEIKPAFCDNSASATCRDLSDHLLNGIHILNPFINPLSFKSWALTTVHETDDVVDIKSLDNFSLLMYKLQLTVFKLFHFPVIGSVLRMLGNSLMQLNIFLATEKQEMIVNHHQQSLEQSRSEKDMRLDMMIGVIMIPVLIIMSLAEAVCRQLLQHRSELIIFSMVTIFSVILLSNF